MKTKTKGVLALTGFVVSIGIYYYLSMAIDLIWLDFCSKNYCMKTLSLAEFLAIEAAAIGVYFVVTSLDDWKHQDKFQTAKINLVKLHEIDSIFLKFKDNLSNFNECHVKYFSNSSSDIDIKETNSFKKYKALKINLKIQDKLDECDLDINTKSINLFQNDFESCINLAKSYFKEIDKDINDLNNEKRVKINNKFTEQQEEKRKLEELINNTPEGLIKDFLTISRGANSALNSTNPTLNNEIDNLDINFEELKLVIEAKNNKYINFIYSLEYIQNKVNKHLG